MTDEEKAAVERVAAYARGIERNGLIHLAADFQTILAAIEIRDEALKAKCERIVEMIEAELLLDGTPDFGDAMWNSTLAKAIEIVRGEI